MLTFLLNKVKDSHGREVAFREAKKENHRQ